MNEPSNSATLLVFAWSAIALFAFLEGTYLARSGNRESARREHARERMRRHATRITNHGSGEESGSILLESGERGPILRYLTSLIPDRVPLDLWLYRAGAPMQLEPFAGLTVALGLIGFGFTLSFTGDVFYAVGASLIAFIPTLYVRRLKAKRMDAFEAEFPNAIDLLGRSLRAGHPLTTGLKIMADESAEPVATEIAQVTEEMGLGLDTRRALENLRRRIGTQDTAYFVNAVLIQRETGGDLPRVLESLAKQTRNRINFHSKVRSLVAQTSASANVLLFFPPLFAVIVSVASPGYMDPMLESPNGRMALGIAAFITITGWLICRRIAVVRI